MGGHVGAYARRLGCLVTRLAPPILCLQSRLWSGVCQVGGSESSIRPTPVTWARPCHPQKASCSQIPWVRGARAGWRPSELWLPGLGVCRLPPFPRPQPGPALASPGFQGWWLTWQGHPRPGWEVTGWSSVGLPGGMREPVWGMLLAPCLAQLGAHLEGQGGPCGWVRVL